MFSKHVFNTPTRHYLYNQGMLQNVIQVYNNHKTIYRQCWSLNLLKKIC